MRLKKYFEDNPVIFVLITSFILGSVYGGFVKPIWNEMVEFGLVAAGKIQFTANNGIFSSRANDFSTQIIVPAILSKLGIPAWPLCILTSAIASGIAFSACSLLSMAIFNLPAFNLLVPFLFVDYHFLVNHFYPVKFPFSFFSFGNFGLYFFALVIGLFVLKHLKLSFLCLGLLLGVHLPWAAGAVIAIVGHSILNKHINYGKKAFLALLTGTIISVLLYAYFIISLRPGIKPVDAGELIQTQVSIPVEKIDKTPAAKSSEPKRATSLIVDSEVLTPVTKDQRRLYPSHNQLIRWADNSFHTFIAFIINEIVLFFLIWLIWRKTPELINPGFKSVIQILAIITAIGMGYKLFEEIHPSLSILSFIHPKLPDYTLRAIVNRWLNINSIFLPILVHSLLLLYSVKQKSLFSVFLIPLSFVFAGFPLFLDIQNRIPKFNPYFTPLQLIVFLFVYLIINGDPKFLSDKLKEKIDIARIRYYSSYFFSWLTIFILVISFRAEILQEKSVRLPFLGKDEYSPLENELKNGVSTILAAPHVHAHNNFNVALRSMRSYYVPHDLTTSINGNTIYVYCNNEKYGYLNFIDLVKKCFNERSLDEWQKIGAALSFQDVLTPSNYNLQLPLVISTKDLSLYRIP